jgi:hypothetical protein
MTRNQVVAVCLFIIHFGCDEKPGTSKMKPELNVHGLTIDSSIKKHVKEKMQEENADDKMKGVEMYFARFDINVYVNDKNIEIPLVTGKGMRQSAGYMYRKDSLSIVINSEMGTSFGVLIKNNKDSCTVSHGFSPRSSNAGTYKLDAADSNYKPGLLVPCKFSLVLDRKEYAENEPIYGYVECVSNDFFERTDSSDNRRRVEYKGYFKATQDYRK